MKQNSLKNKIYLTFFFLIFFQIFFSLKIVLSGENKILFKVNNEIITSIDILNEINYLEILNANIVKNNNNQIFEIAKQSLIREKIKKNELLKYYKKLKIEDDIFTNLIIKYFKEKISINSMNDFEKFFLKKKLDPQYIKEKVIIELLWNQLIFDKYNKQVKINRDQIKKQILSKNKQKVYQLSEIVFNIDANEKFDEKIKMLKKNIQEKGFNQSATIFSISDSSKNAGRLGWIKETAINDKINLELKKIQVGEHTNPITIPGGFIILKIESIREENINIDINKELNNAINKKTNEQLNQFSIIYYNKIKKSNSIYEL